MSEQKFRPFRAKPSGEKREYISIALPFSDASALDAARGPHSLSRNEAIRRALAYVTSIDAWERALIDEAERLPAPLSRVSGEGA